MIQRELLNKLREWRNSERHKPLVLRGARQVGKTTLVNEFGKDFNTYLHLNLEREEDAAIFERSDNVNVIVQYIALRDGKTLESLSDTLLFIDEIQNSPRAVALLRYFYEDMPQLHVIAAGSRLQSLIKSQVSFPVGRIEYLSLRPCSFFEFLTAMNREPLLQSIRNHEVNPLLHDQLMKLFNTYALVGGMPEVVMEYSRHHDVTRLSPIYDTLLQSYNEDVEKYARNQSQSRVIRHILNTGWTMGGEAIKFNNFGGSNYSSREVHEAFEVMQRAFLLNLAYPVTTVNAPALPALRRSPKLLWVDTGIMNFAANLQLEYLSNHELLNVWRGRAAEHIVAQELAILFDKHYMRNMNYWVRAQTGSTAEVDFIWQQGTKIIPIEVKSGTNSHLRSLQSFMRTPDAGDLSIRVWSGELSENILTTDTGHQFKLINVPFYYVGVLDDLMS